MAGVLIATAFVGVTAGAGVLYAHDVLYPGTVLAVETEKLHVKTVDAETKKELNLWFAVTRDTKVRRGDRIVTYVDARIAKDERIVVVVNHDAEAKNVAAELRLAAR
jgi:hypothetical protein